MIRPLIEAARFDKDGKTFYTHGNTYTYSPFGRAWALNRTNDPCGTPGRRRKGDQLSAMSRVSRGRTEPPRRRTLPRGWRRFVQGLHDGPLQIAVAAKVRLQAIRRHVDDPAAAKGLDEGIALVGQVISAMRALLDDRRQPAGSDESLIDHLRRAAERWGEVTGMRVDFSFPNGAPAGTPPFSGETLEIAEDVVRESIVNAWKHGNATQLSVSCEPHDGGLLLTLQDDGSGFPAVEPVVEEGTQMGLRLLRSRVSELGGWFDIRSVNGGGAVVKTWLPPRPTSVEGPE